MNACKKSRNYVNLFTKINIYQFCTTIGLFKCSKMLRITVILYYFVLVVDQITLIHNMQYTYTVRNGTTVVVIYTYVILFFITNVLFIENIRLKGQNVIC